LEIKQAGAQTAKDSPTDAGKWKAVNLAGLELKRAD
jgi:hypothetical protein